MKSQRISPQTCYPLFLSSEGIEGRNCYPVSFFPINSNLSHFWNPLLPLSLQACVSLPPSSLPLSPFSPSPLWLRLTLLTPRTLRSSSTAGIWNLWKSVSSGQPLLKQHTHNLSALFLLPFSGHSSGERSFWRRRGHYPFVQHKGKESFPKAWNSLEHAGSGDQASKSIDIDESLQTAVWTEFVPTVFSTSFASKEGGYLQNGVCSKVFNSTGRKSCKSRYN